MALPGEHGLGNAVAPHGACRGAVGEHAPAVALQIVAGIELREGSHALGHHAVTVRGIGTLVGKGLKLPGNQRTIGPDPGDDMGADGVTDTVGDKGFLPGALQLYQPAAHHGGAPRAQGLIEGVLLVAEAAADVGLDDPHLAPGNSQGLAHHPADDVGNLGRGDHHDPARLHVGKAAVVFNVAVLHGRRVVPALHLHKTRLLTGLGIVAPADIRMRQDILGILFMDLRSPLLHGLLDIQHERQFLILHLQCPDALHCRHLVFGNDHGHLVAVVTDMAVEKHPVRHILMMGVRGPGMARRGEGMIRHVEARQHPHHAGNGLGLGGIDGLDKAVRNGGMADLHHQGAAVAQIVCILGPSGRLFVGVHPDYAFADAFAHRAALLVVFGFRPG